MDTKPLISTEIHEPTALHFEELEEQTDNWDDDFEEGISLAKLQGDVAPCGAQDFLHTNVTVQPLKNAGPSRSQTLLP